MSTEAAGSPVLEAQPFMERNPIHVAVQEMTARRTATPTPLIVSPAPAIGTTSYSDLTLFAWPWICALVGVLFVPVYVGAVMVAVTGIMALVSYRKRRG